MVRARAVAVLLLAALAAGCAPDAEPAASTTADAPTVTPAAQPVPVGRTNMLALAEAQCLVRAELADTDVKTLTLLDCAAGHDAEVFAVRETAGEGFPGGTALAEAGRDHCETAFAQFVGLPWQESRLDFVVLVPSAESWDIAGDRATVCVLVTAADMAGSGRGAGY